MINIVQIVADGSEGGGTTFVLGLAADLQKKGVYRTSIVTSPNSYATRRASELGIPSYGFDFFTSRLDVRHSWRLHRLLNALAPDLVHVHGARAASPFTYGPLYRTPYPLLYTVHGYHFMHKTWPLKKLGVFAERRIARRADRISFVSNGDKIIAESNLVPSSGKSSIVYNGIELPCDVNAPAENKVFDVAFVGRMVRQKNPKFAIDVVNALRNDGRKLIMVGGGALEAKVRKHARDLGLDSLVTFAGALPHQCSLELLKQARILLFPSLWEGLPISPIEAMSLGVPVVASNISGTDEVVSHDATGLLVGRFDPFLYAATIRSLLNDETKLQRFSAAGRQRVYDLFRKDQCTQKYIDIYNDLAKLNEQDVSERNAH